jgi:DNA-binding winged helix-turn-helix (wHTH) protein/tetratricopeptide (TPR) repeat protein
MRAMNLPPTRHENEELENGVRFGRHVAELGVGRLLADGRPVDIEPLPCKLLLYLIRHRHRVVSKQELFEEVFGRPQGGSAALARAVMKTRKALGEAGAASALSTIPRVGYRFVAQVDGGGLEPQKPCESISLAFLPFDHATDDTTIAWVESGLPSLVGEILESDRSIVLVTMPSVLGAVARVHHDSLPERVARVQRATGAAAVVHARVVRAAGGLRADFGLFIGRKVAAGSVIESLPADLAVGMAKVLGRLLGRTGDFTVAAVSLPQDPLAAEAYFRGRQADAAERTEAAINLYRLAHDLEPRHTAIALALLRQLARFGVGDTSAELRSMATELLDSAALAGDRATMVRVHHILAYWRLRRNEPEESEVELSRVIELADGHEGTMFWANVRLLLAFAARNRTRIAEAREQAAHSRRLFRDAGDRAGHLRALMLESGLVSGPEAVELALEAAQGARQLDLPFTLASACNSACMALIDAGRLVEALSHAAEGFAAAVSAGEKGMAEQLVEGSALVCRLAGWPATAAHALADLDALGSPDCYEAIVSLARGLCHGSRGDWSQAAHFLASALENAGTTYVHAYILPWHAEALMFSGRADEAQAAVDAADPALRPSHDFPVHLLLMRAALAHRRGEHETALALLGEALALGPAPMWHAWACVDAAWLNAEAGRSTEAARLLAQIEGPPATLPVVIATQARVRHAAGDVHGALALHRQYVVARKEPSWNDYFGGLGAEYEQQSHAGIRALPRTPFLPSRSC